MTLNRVSNASFPELHALALTPTESLTRFYIPVMATVKKVGLGVWLVWRHLVFHAGFSPAFFSALTLPQMRFQFAANQRSVRLAARHQSHV
jgi:hypothetical protein